MEILYIVLIVLGVCGLILLGYVIGMYDYRAYVERVQVSLCDAYAEIDERTKRYMKLKTNYWKLAREYITDEKALKMMRQANVEIAEEHFKSGYDKGCSDGYDKAWSEVGEALVNESIVIKEGSVVKKIEPVPNQLAKIKD